MYCLAYQKAGLYGEKLQQAGIHNRLCNSLPEGKSLPLPKQSKSKQTASCAPSTLLSRGCAMGEENREKEMASKC